MDSLFVKDRVMDKLQHVADAGAVVPVFRSRTTVKLQNDCNDLMKSYARVKRRELIKKNVAHDLDNPAAKKLKLSMSTRINKMKKAAQKSQEKKAIAERKRRSTVVIKVS